MAQEENQLHAEEKELVRWITHLTATGYSPHYAIMCEIAEEIRQRCVRNINDKFNIYIEYAPIGWNWIKRFLRQHSEISSVTLRMIDVSRINAATTETISHWFDELQCHLWIFSKLKTSLTNEFLQKLLRIGGSLVIQKDGQAITMDWNNYGDVSNLKLMIKWKDNIDFSFVVDMIIILPVNSLAIVWIMIFI